MPYTIEYTKRMLALHNKIQATRATTLTPYGRQWVGVMNRLRMRMAYNLCRNDGRLYS